MGSRKRWQNFQLFPNLFVASVPALWSNIYFVGDIIALATYLLNMNLDLYIRLKPTLDQTETIKLRLG